MVGETAGKVATGVVEGLRSQPLALAVVVINVIFLLFGGWMLKTIAANASARDALLTQLVRDCAK